uniref:CUE domain-containing protein n=1 Tax=Esox lucius TaxID=8010 RepID=A0A6Q2XUJ5_ESOLU
MACAMVPLDEQQVTEAAGPMGKERTLPALHPDRKEERCFVPYKPPPEDSSPAEVEEFLEHGRFITEDLDWLLNLPHDKFWCQVVFDESLQNCLDSYLRHAPRGLDPSSLPSSPAMAEMQRSIHRAVFMTFLRMATHKESKESFITPSVFGEIIYNNFLFDIPKILDLCVLFGKGNSQLLHKMIGELSNGTFLPAQTDVEPMFPPKVMDTILAKCGLQCEGAPATEPLKLNSHGRPSAMTMSQQDLVDLVLYLCDSCTTIQAFLDIFPAACSTFHCHSFLNRLASFYEAAVPDLEKAVRKRNFDDKSLQEDLWNRVCHSRRRMVETCCLVIILLLLCDGWDFKENVCLLFILVCLSVRFLADYDEQFPVADDVSLLQQAFPLMYPLACVFLMIMKFNLQSTFHGSNQGYVVQGAACTISAGELESLLSHIRDLLPDLGEGFLLACLKQYNYNSELVINYILEDRLHPDLDKLDRAMPRPTKEELPPVLSTRSNVFDDDEFDVFNRDQVDMTRVWKGRRKGESTRELLDNKQHIAELKERYMAYETVVDEVVVTPGEPGATYDLDDYDDEYDDTYDINQVGANDLDGDTDLLNRRPFTIPQVLRQGGKPTVLEEEEGEDEEEDEKVPDQFVQDPALLRERAEARRAAMQHRKGYRPEPARERDVVGKPKGQGQTTETLLDRRKKEAHKSRGANHNRRAMSDRKRNKGMIPS